MSNQAPGQPKAGSNTLRKVGFLSLGFLFSAAALWYVFRDIDFHQLLEYTERIRWELLAASIGLYWAGLVVIRSFLVRHLIDSATPAPVGKIYRYICVGFLANNILPARMGEVIRVAGFARVSNTPLVSVAGSAALERLLDFTMLAVIGFVALLVAPVPEGIRMTIFLLGGGLAVAFAVLIFVARRDLKPIEGEKQTTKTLLWNLLVRFTAGLKSLATSNGIVKAIALSVGIWVFALTVLLFRLGSFGLPMSIPMVLVLTTSLSLGVSLPSAPAYVGVYHVFAAGALVLFGVDESVAVGFAVFCHLADVIPGCILGAISMLLEGVRFADLKGRPPKENVS